MENTIRHLGIIMDGNRRWARKHALQSVLEGHRRGAYRLLDVCEWCEDVGIDYLTVYAFSTENWRRSAEEVDGLFKLIDVFFAQEMDRCIKNGVKIRIIGNRDMISEHSLETIRRTESMTADCNKLILNIALSYGGRDEILRAAKSCCSDVMSGRLDINDINEKAFADRSDSAGLPDIDLMIRTGGQHRLSNFCPWLTVYSELYFTDTLWPDFNRRMFDKAIKYYAGININNGK